MSGKITFAMDKNLGFPVEDEKWQQFFKKFHIEMIVYDDMKKMTDDMEKNTVTFAYLPTANFFYFKDDAFYEPIANALFAANHTSQISSLLIVSKQSNITSLSQLQGKSLGYINLYCTSSYFAPAILLWKHHYSIHHFFSQMKAVGAWQLQIDAVIKGEVDATTIQEDIWYKLPENKEKTRIIAKEDGLPSPLILCAKNSDEAFKRELKELLFSYKPKPPPNALFSGFIPFQKDQVKAFYSDATQAFGGSLQKAASTN